MILTDLKDYIEAQGTVSRTHLAKHFAMSEDGIDAMLGVWIKKGVVSRYIDTNKAQHVTRVRYGINQSGGLSLTVRM